MTMRRAGVMQDFVRAEKREGREAKASAEAQREAAMVEMQRADLRRDVATAWFEKLYAERSVALVRAMIDEAELQTSTATAAVAAGKGAASEPVAARALSATLRDRLFDTERQVRRAAAMLSRWIGDEAERQQVAPPDIRSLAHHGGSIDKDLELHPHLAIYVPMEAAAAADLKLAEAAKQPDWSAELSYAQRGPTFANMVSLIVRVDLPILASRRQEPVVASKLAQLRQVRAQADDARQRHLAEIRAGLVDWEAARARVDRYAKEIVPLAEERSRLATAAYSAARADLPAVLDARRALLEARLAALQAEAELARAWAQLAYLIPAHEVHR
jgi:outer membrane protein TolC